jgi:hypothetical protein
LTLAFATGLQLLLESTTAIISVIVVPLLPSRMSLRKSSASEGYGPTVSDGVTAQAALVVPVPVVVVVMVDGLVGLFPPHPSASAAPAAPIAHIASRRPICLLFISLLAAHGNQSSFVLPLE